MKKIHTFDEVYDSQRLFRLILTALSNPTRTVNIKEFSNKLFGKSPEFLAVALTLLDNEVSFYTNEDKELARDIVLLTLSKIEKINNADYLFVTDITKLQNSVQNSKCGTLRDPHKSATLIIRIDDKKDTDLTLYGAGIDKTISFKTSAAVKAALDIRDSQFYEYPQGVDLIFVTDDGDLFAIPRLTRREAV
jgi:alpha-D-ribose 1-methylphosphonate 5-triphosphate synthase subunit PhnH